MAELTISKHMLLLQASRASVRLVELPIVTAPVHSSLFVLPSFSDVFPLLPTDIDHILQRKVSDVVNHTAYCIIVVLAQPVSHFKPQSCHRKPPWNVLSHKPPQNF